MVLKLIQLAPQSLFFLIARRPLFPNLRLMLCNMSFASASRHLVRGKGISRVIKWCCFVDEGRFRKMFPLSKGCDEIKFIILYIGKRSEMTLLGVIWLVFCFSVVLVEVRPIIC